MSSSDGQGLILRGSPPSSSSVTQMGTRAKSARYRPGLSESSRLAPSSAMGSPDGKPSRRGRCPPRAGRQSLGPTQERPFVDCGIGVRAGAAGDSPRPPRLVPIGLPTGRGAVPLGPATHDCSGGQCQPVSVGSGYLLAAHSDNDMDVSVRTPLPHSVFKPPRGSRDRCRGGR